MLKILFDFAPSDTPTNCPNYNLDMACREEIDHYVYTEYHYQDIFDKHYSIISGTLPEKNHRLQEILVEMAQAYHDEIIYMHFLGHGTKDMTGIQFVRYEDLYKWLLPIKKRNVILLNMMSTCYSVGMIHYSECYNVLWYSIGEVQDYCAPFDFAKYFLQEDGVAKFEEFARQFKMDLLRECRT